MDIVNLAIKVGTGEVDRAQKELQGLQKELNSTESAAYKLGSAIGTSMKFAAASFIGLSAGVATISVVMAKHIDDLQDVADMYGYSASQVAILSAAAEAAGGKFEDVVKATSRVKKELASGGEAFKNLGINVYETNGKMKDAEKLATDVAVKYAEGKTTVEQYADVQKILGKDVEATTTVLLGQVKAQKLLTEMQEKGIGIVEGATKAAGDYEDATLRASFVVQAAGSILVAKVVPAFTSLITALTDSYVNGGLVREMFNSFLDLLPGIIEFGGTVVKIFITAANVVRAFGDTLGAGAAIVGALVDRNWAGARDIAKAWKFNIDQIEEQNQRALAAVERTAKGMADVVRNADGTTLGAASAKRKSTGGLGLSDSEKRAAEQAAKEAERLAKEAERERLKALKEEQDFMSKRALAEMKRYDELEAAAEKEYQSLMKRVQGYEDLADPTAKYRRELELLIKDYETGYVAIDAYVAKTKEIQEAIVKATTPTAEMADSLKLITRIGETAFQGLEDSLMEFVTTGKFNFRNFVGSVLQDIARLIIQLQVVAPLMKSFTGAMSSSGGGWGALGSAAASWIGGLFADGGDPPVGKVSVVGERGPELFVPKNAGTIIPNSALGGNAVVNNMVVNIGSVDNDQRKDELLKGIKELMVSTSKQTIAKEMRSGGMLNRKYVNGA